MPVRAVIFDLFGTLVDNDSFVGSFSTELDDLIIQMARVLSANPEPFARLWNEMLPLRTIGVLPSIEVCLEKISSSLGLNVSLEQLRDAAELRIAYNRRKLIPRPDAIETLNRLRAKGYRTGLISNCSPDVPLLWETTALAALVDAPIFSCSAGLAKPDPAIFRLACERLRLQAEQCLYVADGEGGELAAAAALGMRSVLIRCSYQDPPDFRRPHVEEWDGSSVCCLADVPALLEGL